MITILVTGGAGFIGSHFVKLMVNKYSDYKIINLDKLTYAGDLKNIESLRGINRHIFIQGDIADKKMLEKIFLEHDIQSVVHFAAESHVDNSIADPSNFIETNIVGTFNLLEVAKNYWQKNISGDSIVNKFHHVSTDEVYGSLGEVGAFSETTAYAPNSPYSASKASSDMLVRSYNKTYGLNTLVTHCSNNFGPNQHDEKLIPTVIRNAIAGKEIPIYGSGKNKRDWLFVLEHCFALDKVFHKGIIGETYCIGADNEWSNLDLAKRICYHLDSMLPRTNSSSYCELITHVKDRLGHDYRYAIDSTKIQQLLSWKSTTNFDKALQITISWYLEKYQNTYELESFREKVT